jgi:hypothetical protein
VDQAPTKAEPGKKTTTDPGFGFDDDERRHRTAVEDDDDTDSCYGGIIMHVT